MARSASLNRARELALADQAFDAAHGKGHASPLWYYVLLHIRAIRARERFEGDGMSPGFQIIEPERRSA
jgi:hypothetical protein